VFESRMLRRILGPEWE